MKQRRTYFSLILALVVIIARSGSAQDEWSWEQVAPLDVPRMGHCAAVLGDSIYVFGGMSFHRRMEITNSVEVYDPVADKWTQGEPLPIPLYQASAVVRGRNIYLIGGTTRGGGPNTDIIVYNPGDGYSRNGRIPNPRWALGVVATGRRILVIGGISERQQYHRDGFWWNPDSMQWIPAPPLNHPAAGFGLAFNGVLWAVGGISFGPTNRVEVLRNGNWEVLPRRSNLPEPRGELGVTFLGDTLLIAAGGVSQDGTSARVFALATDSLLWTRLPDMNENRAEFTLVNWRGLAFAIGGGTMGDEHRGVIYNSVEVLRRANAIGTETEPEIQAEFLPSIWPNPVNGVVSVSIPPTSGKLQLIDLNGRIMTETPLAGGSNVWSWDLSRYPAGRYTVIYFDAGGLARATRGLTVIK